MCKSGGSFSRAGSGKVSPDVRLGSAAPLVAYAYEYAYY